MSFLNDFHFESSSEESVSTVLKKPKKNPYIPFYIVSEHNVLREAPVERYGPQNQMYFTLRVSHSGILCDRPGETYRRSTVTYFEAVNIHRLDLNELYLLSRHLGFPEMGKWYYFNDGVELLPLRTEDHIASFRQVIQDHHFNAIEKVYVEHGLSVADRYKLIPKEVMESGKKRIEKLVYLLLLSNPEASAEEGVARVKLMMGLEVPRGKMERCMRQARIQLGMW